MSARCGTLATFVIVGLALLHGVAAYGSFPGQDGVIVYAAGYNYGGSVFGGDLWAIDPATGNQRRLTVGVNDAEPAFSPDGNLLAFEQEVNGRPVIYVSAADGSNARALVAGRQPAFSPDGTRMVFARRGHLFIVRLDRPAAVTRLTNHAQDRLPAWSTAGVIAFQRSFPALHPREGELHFQELDVIRPPSHTVHRVLSGKIAANLWPDWSPDGRTLSVALCAKRARPPMSLPTTPPVVSHELCEPDLWAPAGNGVLLEPGKGVLAGRPDTSCPVNRFGPDMLAAERWREMDGSSRFAWQPVGPGTMQIETAPCTPRPETRVPEEPECVLFAPCQGGGPPAGGSKLCVRLRHRHRVECFKL